MSYRLILLLALAALVLIFIIQNTAVVEFSLLFWTVAMSRSLMFFVLVGLGVAIGWFLRGYLSGSRPR
jgi:uncharacterized integral membrane protein